MFGDTSGNFLRDHSFTSFQFFSAGKQVKLIPRLKSSRGNPRNQSRPIRFYQNSDVMVTSQKEAASLSLKSIKIVGPFCSGAKHFAINEKIVKLFYTFLPKFPLTGR